ncbi:hypothetical protein [Candidatus Chlorobium masyuteum]|uniref:hypothetical protein n=1 Tax=Candidatus Chlorobium masyuteum TaxID=2716876 RepID=UPI00141D8EB3|nr:hypothetical protein [Candidatus Chlorobium masyuteum]
MVYQLTAVDKLQQEHSMVQADLVEIYIKTCQAGNSVGNTRAREYLLHGAERRVRLLRGCLSNVFKQFPPDATKPITSEALEEVQISLHAFVMNLYGFFENLAWAYVFRHDLVKVIGDRRKIGMFLRSTQEHLPKVLSDYLTSTTIVAWHNDYLKNYRDSLAHRIPLYIPPSELTQDEAQRINALEKEKFECLNKSQLDRFDEIRTEQASLGTASTVFLHSFEDEEASKPVQLHPQMLCDAMTVAEFGSLYFMHWHERV